MLCYPPLRLEACVGDDLSMTKKTPSLMRLLALTVLLTLVASLRSGPRVDRGSVGRATGLLKTVRNPCEDQKPVHRGAPRPNVRAARVDLSSGGEDGFRLHRMRSHDDAYPALWHRSVHERI